MHVLAIEAALLRGLAPQAALRVDAVIAARVVDRDGPNGTLAMMGMLIEADLPDGLEAGQTVRLRVEEATAEKIGLRVVDQPAVPTATPVAIPLPGGGEARVVVERREDGSGENGEDVPSVALSYESPTLGRLDLTLTIPPGEVTAKVAAPAGEAFDRADSAAEALIAALEEATDRRARVTVAPRHDPFETYA